MQEYMTGYIRFTLVFKRWLHLYLVYIGVYRHMTVYASIYPGEKVTEVFNKVTERDQKVTELPNSL